MRRLKLTLTDTDGVVLEQYEVRNDRELHPLPHEDKDKFYDDSSVIYVDPDRPRVLWLDELQHDIGVHLSTPE